MKLWTISVSEDKNAVLITELNALLAFVHYYETTVTGKKISSAY